MVKLELILIDAQDQEKAIEVVCSSRVEALHLAACTFPGTIGAFLIDQSASAETDPRIKEL